jgi:hypothetical protein
LHLAFLGGKVNKDPRDTFASSLEHHHRNVATLSLFGTRQLIPPHGLEVGNKLCSFGRPSVKLDYDKENRAPRGMGQAEKKAKGSTPGRPKKKGTQFWDIGKVGRYVHAAGDCLRVKSRGD